VLEKLKEVDPAHWERFLESQEKARANVSVDLANKTPPPSQEDADDEVAVSD
jgi:hypothetical protein